MSINSVKDTIRKSEETRSLDVAPGRGKCATNPVIMEEVAIAAA